MRNLILLIVATVASALFGAEAPKPASPPREIRSAPVVRIKDVADIQGMRDNQLVGEGLVVGLDGQGDQNSGPLTAQALANFMARLGVNVPAAQLTPKNIAVVAITAQLPPFIKKGEKIDVQVSSVGDAKTLQGGVLLQTPLQGADGRVYAVAQGAISVGGFSAGGGGGGGGATVTKNHTLVGRVPNGALVEREVETTIVKDGIAQVALRRGDFTTAQRMATCICARWPGSAKALDPHTVEFALPTPENKDVPPMAVLAELECLSFLPDMPARVVINERTGTIVAGAQVRLAPTVMSHGNLVITIKQTPVISQPEALSQGTTAIATETSVEGKEEKSHAIVLDPEPTLSDLAAALNALKVTPRDIIAIFQALKEAGALSAELVIM